MELSHAAIVWSVARQQAPAAAPKAATLRPARAARFGRRLRLLAFRAQLGPASGNAAA